jgi:pyruvate/2-oxoglutarate dehydrogenase complex dihydrolipoamide acyltransferase (E2) component
VVVPIRLPELGAETHSVCVSSWFVEPGESIAAGEVIAEVLLGGVTFDIAAPGAGRLERIEKQVDASVQPGDILGWIEPDREFNSSAGGRRSDA